MEVSRKRKLSTEASFCPQIKCYVDQNTQNRQNEKKMQEIYSKTVNLLFKAAKERQQGVYVDKNAKFRELKALEENPSIGGKMPEWYTEAPVLVCNTCMSNSKVAVDCLNCNMTVCERCALSCNSCKDPLCNSCVNLL